jgi:creatinine amidohydrolase
VLHPTAWPELDSRTELLEIHGGKNETSMMLALVPNVVRLERIVQLPSSINRDVVKATILDQNVTWPWTTNEKQIADLGVIGDAKAASAEFGECLLSQIEEKAEAVFKQLLDRQHLVRG